MSARPLPRHLVDAMRHMRSEKIAARDIAIATGKSKHTVSAKAGRRRAPRAAIKTTYAGGAQ